MTTHAPDDTSRPSPTRRSSAVVGWLLALLLFLLACAATAYAIPTWLDNQGTFSASAGAVDLDGDGDLDILLHNLRREAEFTAFGGATLWLNEGDGRFLARPLPQDSTGGGWDSTAVDFDRDGDADLLLFAGHHLRLVVNQGNEQAGTAGDFRPGLRIAGPEPNGQFGTVLSDDFNGDGRPDAVVFGCCGRVFTVRADESTPNVSGVWLNSGREGGGPASLSPLPALDGLAVLAAATGDLNGDGAPDLLALTQAPGESSETARVLLNDGAGDFADSGQRLSVPGGTAVALGDLDGDGDADALIGDRDGAGVWLNQGDASGVLAASGERLAAGPVRSLLLHDLDGDGRPDAVLGNELEAGLWWNDGRGAFAPGHQRFAISKRHGLAAGDFNGDGLPDLFAGAYDDAYRVWFNQGDGRFQGRLWP